MFKVYDKNGAGRIVYAIKEENGVIEFLMYFGQWEWYPASDFYPAETCG